VIRRRHLGAILFASLLAACTVGPNFHPPQVKTPADWGAEPTDVGSTTYGGPIEEKWWNSFQDPELTSLEARLAVQNIDLQTALERVTQAEAETQVTASQGRPNITAESEFARERESPNGPVSLVEPAPDAPLAFNQFENLVQASWEIDLFGKVRRANEAANANTVAVIEARHAIALKAISDLAQDYMDLRGVQTQLAIVEQNLDLANKNLTLVQRQLADGVATNSDVDNAETQIAEIAASIIPMQQQIDQQINAIGFLLALPPRALTSELQVSSGLPIVPPSVPVGLPSTLLLRRPDIREALAKLHEAVAETGVAVASFYPDITLGAHAGLQGLDIGNAFSLPDLEYQLGPSVSLPLFEGGHLTGTLKLRKSQQREAALDYRQTVLRAWQDVDNALTAYALGQQEQTELATTVAKSEKTLVDARQNFQDGTVGFLNVTAAQAQVLNNQQNLAQADTMLDIDFVNLYRALGGGWAIVDRSGT
jgi:NodT family efflux transporter outer membrane factor (OMF) lipoprotein